MKISWVSVVFAGIMTASILSIGGCTSEKATSSTQKGGNVVTTEAPLEMGTKEYFDRRYEERIENKLERRH